MMTNIINRLLRIVVIVTRQGQDHYQDAVGRGLVP